MKTSYLAGMGVAALVLAGPVIAQETTAEKSNAATTVSPSIAAEAPNSAATGSYATAQSANDWRSSKIIGLNVYNSKNEKIGDINDLIIGSNGVITHAVVGVGGFLGMGEKNVAVPFTSVKMSRDKNGKPTAMVDTTKEALQAAPTFKFYTSAS
jgi:sporulation protein YlmC with PRC-barrel domain